LYPEYIKPSFSGTWIGTSPPSGELLGEYSIDGSPIKVYDVDGQMVYYILPSEYAFSDKFVNAMKKFPDFLMKNTSDIDISDADAIRNYVDSGAIRFLDTLELPDEEARVFPHIARKYTVGYGVMEVLFKDRHIQDIFVDAPSTDRITVNLSGISGSESGLAVTNMRISEEESNSLLTRIKYFTGSAFGYKKPVMETSLNDFPVRVTIIGPPMSTNGISMAFRRHSTTPWTLPMLVYNQTIPLGISGYLSILPYANMSILIAGTRGSGKTSLLTALLSEFPPDQRIISIEDTVEIPVDDLRDCGVKIISLSADGESVDPESALKVSLRMGDTAYVMGEVRGKEAKTLYEAMRTGTAGSSVLATIHADSPESVRTRIIDDLGVTPGAFESTDVIIMLEPFRPAGKRRFMRRLTRITEIQNGEMTDIFRINEGFNISKSKVIRKLSDKWEVKPEHIYRDMNFRKDIVAYIVNMMNGGNYSAGEMEGVSMSRKAYNVCKENGVYDINRWLNYYGGNNDNI